MEYIFMSYAHKDSEWTIPIFNRMQEDGFEIWKIQAQEKRDQAKAGELDMYDYEEWLKQ